jgi:TRAP transporter TAXI family solute receptor
MVQIRRFATRLRIVTSGPAAIASLLVLIVATAGCARKVSAPQGRTVVHLAVGGQALVDAYKKLMPDVTFELVTTGGSVTQLQALQNGTADVGTAMADVAYMAFANRFGEPAGAFDRLRAMAVLQPATIHVIVPGNSTRSSIADLRGARVALGARGSGTALGAKMLLGAFGLTMEDVRGEFLPFEDASARLTHGELDAAFMTSPYPAAAVARATRAGAKLLEVVGPAAERLRLEYPFFRKTLIPQVVYEGQHHSIHTMGVDDVLLCRADLDEALAYRLVRVLLETLPYPASDNGTVVQINFRRAPATPLPLHPGAARYYRERELSR